MANILVTGGAGYIGSHTVVELLDVGHKVTVIDNLSNSNQEVLNRVKRITGKDADFVCVNLCDYQSLEDVFVKTSFDAVIHFAGYKAVGESVAKPLDYYRNNLESTFNLLRLMLKFNVTRIVFSSSATVYGTPKEVPIREDAPLSCTNPYGWTKYMNERILTDTQIANPHLSVVLLRYFNPVGAHSSGLIGEDPVGIPNNLMPYITQVATGRREKLHVFGNDYPTPDGTGVRDYIHITDLAKGHVAAIEYSFKRTGIDVFNLGTGRGTSVLELVRTFERVNDRRIPYVIDPRRPGDIATCYADPDKAKKVLGWEAELDLADMCRDAWNWQSKNPQGYRT
ncbi:MAG: UDP-glucose 4-epimerase GalE [Clostridiaceae bacterium]|nr:UDP-glucose 4-epimerase GalE [Clostridiaceae bacterium]